MIYYRPRSEASEGYVFTGVCHSVTGMLYSGKQTDVTAIDFQPIGDRLTNEKFSGICLFTTIGRRYVSYWNASLFGYVFRGKYNHFPHCLVSSNCLFLIITMVPNYSHSLKKYFSPFYRPHSIAKWGR